ncbi:unnamed protein product [Gongylonema pulchrum]|uniref:Uncharacterized protein n=1 Tax=Gongylonema pulchrum TaxID=637853 RepID=A0A3P6R8A0_9BILA|nr:unnamed protein product [Gongylonema pulchrum]
MLDRSAGGIRGRSLRVCNVVDSEMELLAASAYRDRVRMATKLLRDDVINQFADRAEKVVNKLEHEAAEGANAGDRDFKEDVDDFIEASELMSDTENEQKIMRHLPEEEKRKIQEQIDVFKGVITSSALLLSSAGCFVICGTVR